MTNQNLPSNIPNPDPSVVANERLEEAKGTLRREMAVNRNESKGWVEALQILMERDQGSLKNFMVEKIEGGLRNVGTRLDGNDTALVAALKAQKEEAANQTGAFKEILAEFKRGMEKQFDSLNEKIDELRTRLNRVEAMNLGANFTRSESKDQTALDQHQRGNLIAMFAAAVGVAALILTIYTLTRPTAPAVVYATPDISQGSPRLQHQVFPLAPPWDNGFYKFGIDISRAAN